MVYNLFALFSVAPLVFWEHYAGSVTIYTWPGTLLPLRLLLLVAAAWLLLAGARVFPLRSFTGWAQLSGDVPDGETETPLVTSGVLARVRHPRITSYNVCYTKLLRAIHTEKAEREPRKER